MRPAVLRSAAGALRFGRHDRESTYPTSRDQFRGHGVVRQQSVIYCQFSESADALSLNEYNVSS